MFTCLETLSYPSSTHGALANRNSIPFVDFLCFHPWPYERRAHLGDVWEHLTFGIGNYVGNEI